jgi:hypothetical protein
MGCGVMSGFAVFIQYLNSMSSLSSSDYTQPSPPMAAPAIDLLTLSDRHHPTKPLQRQHAEAPKQPIEAARWRTTWHRLWGESDG